MIYGVYIWKNKLFVIDTLELGSEYPVLELQLDAEGFDQLLDMHVFQSIFKQIYDNIGLKESDGLVIAYPDSYGIWERGIIYHNAKKTGKILRLVSVSTAVSMSITTTGDDEEYVVVLQTERGQGVSSVCDIEHGICEEVCRFGALSNGQLSDKWLPEQDSYIPLSYMRKIVVMDSDDIVDRMVQVLI